MPWDRGAWEKRTSEGAGKQIIVSRGKGETVNESRHVATNFSGGISFCPECGSMMSNRNGTLTCSKCGYREYSSSYSPSKNRINQQQRKRKEKENRQKIKKQMRDVLFYMYQGKSRSQASALSGVPLSKISNWYNEGKSGYGYDNIHFYHEVSSIELTQERRKREEINRQNRLREEERKRKQREAKQRRERLQKQSEQNTIKKQMDEIIKQMRNGETRSQAAINVGVPIYKVDEWYDLGWRRKKEPYTSFYNKVNTIEIRNRKTSEVKTVTPSKDNSIKQMREIVSLMEKGSTRSEAARKLDLNVATVNSWYNKGSNGALTYVKFYNDVKKIEDKRKKPASTYKSRLYTSSKDDNENKMNELVSQMKNGLTRNKAAEKLGLSVITVNNWYNKGSHGNPTYVRFYNDVKSIESSQKKSKSTHTPKSTTSNMIKCPKCNEKYNKKLYKECPNCKKTKEYAEVKYCENCGTKITDEDLNYCSNCGISLKDNKNADVVIPTNNKYDWSAGIIAIVLIFIFIVVLQAYI